MWSSEHREPMNNAQGLNRRGSRFSIALMMGNSESGEDTDRQIHGEVGSNADGRGILVENAVGVTVKSETPVSGERLECARVQIILFLLNQPS